ncbi:hypothetical protein BKI52_39715 [marine bacterium AO1-C]|nr:hypothetical protein BKI52_39715 [marine bacterium AO1-C]
MDIYFKIIVICSILPLGLQAQVNESDTARFQLQTTLTGVWQEGNAEVLIFRAKALASFRASNRLVFKTQNAHLYQEFFKRKADEDFFSRNFIYYRPSQKVYPFLLGFLNTNFRRKVDLRYFLGGGVTWQLIQARSQLLKVAISGEYEESRFAQSNFSDNRFDGSSTISTWRATVWLFGRYQLGKKLILHYEAYYQPSFHLANNYRWQTDIGLEIPLWRFLNFRVNHLYTHENVVVLGTRQTDSIVTFGIRLILK